MTSKVWSTGLAVLALLGGTGAWAAQAGPPPPAPEGNGSSDLGAKRQFESGRDLLAAREYERGLKLLEGVLERYPNDPLRFNVYLVLGKHHLEQKRYPEALGWLGRLNALEKPDEPLTGESRELFLEGLYLNGVACFEQHQYERVFPVLRRITLNYPNTKWANLAYYYIGMSHFGMGNWNKAIENLGLVGTVVDPNSPALQYAEAGRRFYIKIMDADLPILHRLGKEVSVEIKTSSGDREKVVCLPLSGKGDVFIGSVPTEVGVAKPGDGTLQTVSGDAVTVTYADDNTQSGMKDVPRSASIQVVSTAALAFTTGTYESPAPAAFLGQPLFVSLFDADLDTTPQADRATVKIASRYREEDSGDDAAAEKSKDEKWKIRDEVSLALTETGEGPVVRTGRFGGSVKVEGLKEGQTVDRTDQVLTCAVGDEIVASYTDEKHMGGTVAREVKARIQVSGELENRPRAEQYVVTDPLIRAKKNNVEATAYLELARIFASMGLTDGAKAKADEGLTLADVIVRAPEQVPSALREKAFELKWELELAKDDYTSALATCQFFAKLFPNSPLVDQALLGMGKARMDAKMYKEATEIFQRLLALPQSQAKAEAQFKIAEAAEIMAEAAAASATGGRGAGETHPANTAIQQYRLVADRYPGSPFAGVALGKIVDYYIRSKDFAQADDLLEQVFTDHPDAKFLDEMLLKWAIVAYRRDDFVKAQQKLTQLIFEYPESKLADEARKFLPQVEAKLKK